MKIVPAILTDNKKNFSKMLEACRTFTDYVQVDIMDGEFVPSRSIIAKDVETVNVPIRSEAHLMVKEPLRWISAFKRFGSERIIFHFEIKSKHLEIIDAIKRAGLEAGIAINPATEIKDFDFLVNRVDSVLFMSVVPGFYGAEFIPQVLEKIKKFKTLYPKKTTGIDGGVKLDNLKQVVQSNVDYICIGSAILKAADSKEAYLKILDSIK